MQTEIELHGGVFERELIYDHTTYLIARNVESEKYKTAVEWANIVIVNEDWLEDSISGGSIGFYSNSMKNFKTPFAIRTTHKLSELHDRTKQPMSQPPSQIPVFLSFNPSITVLFTIHFDCSLFDTEQNSRSYTS